MANPNRRSSFNKAFRFISLKDIPGPRGVPYFQYVRHFQRDILGAFTKVNSEFGDIASFPWPMNSVIIYSPDLVKAVLVDQGKSFIKGEQIEELRAVVGNGLATNNDHASWLKSRALLSKEFNSKAVSAFINDFISITRESCAQFAHKTETDVCEEMKLLTFRIATQTFLGAQLSDEDAKAVNEAVTYTSEVTYKRIFQIFPVPYWIPAPGIIKFNQHYRVLNDIVMGLIKKERAASSPDKKGILQKLVHARDVDTNFAFSDDELRDEMLTLMIAGHETSAHTLTWALGLLAKHQDIQEKLFEEIKHLGSDSPLLKNVLLETMRLYPAFPVLSRKAAQAVTIGQRTIPKDTNVVIPIYVMQRNESYWKNPLTFDPSRYENDAYEKAYTFLPFSRGQRRCIAELFAMTEMSVILIEFLKMYKLKLNGELPQEEAFVSLKPIGGMPLLLSPR
jgi:cytochrome P450